MKKMSMLSVAALLLMMLSVMIVPTVTAASPVSTDAASASGSFATTAKGNATTTKYVGTTTQSTTRTTQPTVADQPDITVSENSLLPTNASKFNLVSAGPAGVEASIDVYTNSDSYTFFSRQDGWPYAWYEAPEEEWVVANINDPYCFLNWDFKVVSGLTCITVYFGGQDPDSLAAEGTAENINYYINPANGKLTDPMYQDLSVGTYVGRIRASQMGVSEDLIDENGNFYISGIKIFAVNAGVVTVNDVWVGNDLVYTTTTKYVGTTTQSTTRTTQPTVADQPDITVSENSLLPTNASKFNLVNYAPIGLEASIAVYNNDKGYTFSSGQDGWPYAWYEAPEEEWVVANINDPDCYLNWDFEVVSGLTCITVYFGGQDPESSAAEGTAENISYYIDPANGKLSDLTGIDLPSGTYTGRIRASQMGVSEDLIDENGNFYISGIKLYCYNDGEVNVNDVWVSGASTTPEDPETAMLGDLNDDGIVNMIDAFLLYKAVSTGTLTEEQRKVSDLNSDGIVNIIDAFQLYASVAGQ